MIGIKLKEWEKFKREKTQGRPPQYEKCGVACPECGSEIWLDRMLIITSCPPRNKYFCENCGWHGYV